MKNIILLLVFLPGVLGAEVQLSLDKTTVFTNELVKVEVRVPGNDTQAPLGLNIEGSPWEILSQKVVESFTWNQMDQSSSENVIYRLEMLFSGSGEISVTARVKGNESKTLIMTLTDPMLPEEAELPFFNTYISKEKLYTGEGGHVTHILFDKEYIPQVHYTRSPMELETFKLGTPGQQKIVHKGEVVNYRILAAYSYSSEIPGNYLIPAKEIFYKEKNFKTPEQKIEILPLPEEIASHSLRGSTLSLSLELPEEKYPYRTPVTFEILLKGDVSLGNITSLKDFFSVPNWLTEEKILHNGYIREGQMVQNVKFRYSGVVNSLTGFRLPRISIPFYNTATGEEESVVYESRRVEGSFPVLLFYMGLVLIVVLTAAVVLFSLNLMRKRKPQKLQNKGDFSAAYNLSKRESEILPVLTLGKSTKEIAEELCISPETVKKHIQNMLKKTETRSRIELLALVNRGLS